MRYEAENIPLTKKMTANLCDISMPFINQHLQRILVGNDLTREASEKCSAEIPGLDNGHLQPYGW